jgi:broad-specificity NMP kinase
MVVMINGSFGVGKTTVANLLRKFISGSVIYDPEWTGFVLRRLPGWIKLEGSGTDDYQNIRLWRKSAVAGVRLFRCFASGPVIVPMTFSDRAYFDEIISGIMSFESALKVFCLRASLSTVRSRLLQRGAHIEGADAEWIDRRVVECIEAHRNSHFGESIETDDRPPLEIAREIIERLRLLCALPRCGQHER